MSSTRLLSVAAVLLATAPLYGQVPVVRAEPAECFPKADNGIVFATLGEAPGGVSTRLYFRWDEDEDFYYVLMTAAGNGRYWGTPAKPDDENEGIEYYVALVDPLGEVFAKSDALHSPVDKGCEVELDEKQRGTAENLTVGETTFEQVGEMVDGFLCDGIVSRINPDGVLRGDEACRACVIAWRRRGALLLPIAGAVGLGGVILTRDEPPRASPFEP